MIQYQIMIAYLESLFDLTLQSLTCDIRPFIPLDASQENSIGCFSREGFGLDNEGVDTCDQELSFFDIMMKLRILKMERNKMIS